MVSGSALLRVLLLLVAAAALAGLVQHYWTHDGGLPETPLVAAPSDAGPVRRSEPAAAQPLEATSAPTAPEAPAAAAVQTAQPSPQPSLFQAPEPPPAAPALQGAARDAPPAPPSAAPRVSAPPTPRDEVANAADNAGPPATDLVDLNSAPLADLNRLKGGGAIGRAIVQHRPYASVDQLLSKRVLSRATYQKVKDQVTVR